MKNFSKIVFCTTCAIFLSLLLWKFLPFSQKLSLLSLPSSNSAADQSIANKPNFQKSSHASVIVGPQPDKKQISKDFENFSVWTQNITSNPSQELNSNDLQQGIELAKQRQQAMLKLIEQDPKEALSKALPFHIRSQLPSQLQPYLEKQISGRGNYGVLVSDFEDGTTKFSRQVEVNGKTYNAFVYGRRLAQTSKTNIPIHGIAVGTSLALSESPVRLLEPGETPDPNTPVANVDGACPVSGNTASSEVAADVGGKIYYLCNGGHILQLEQQLIAEEGGTSDVVAQDVATSWTTGTKTVLFIRVNYPDDLTDPQSGTSATNIMNQCSNFMLENSYGVTSMITTVTPLFTLPKTKAEYVAMGDYTGSQVLYSDALSVASANGYIHTDYNLECVRFQGGPGNYLGQAYVSTRGCWLKSSALSVPSHEFGHNYGLFHANYWNYKTENPIGSGGNLEYGDPFDTMGRTGGGGVYHYSAYQKNTLGWLPDENVINITNNGTYRITTFDQPNLVGSTVYALKINKDFKDYWMDFRQKFTGNKWLMNGIDLHWSPLPGTNSNSGPLLIDTTPNSPDGRSDTALVIGRTFADPYAGIFITPIKKVGTIPEAIDVVVNRGSFPGNVSPTVTVSASATAVATGVVVNLSAVASDPNGDPLAYSWNFGDRTFGSNTFSVSKSWSTAGEYVVQCTVSDMKGGIGSDSAIIMVGSPTTTRISGKVTYSGLPLVGVHIIGTNLTSTFHAFTDSDGTYTLVNIPAGNCTVSAGTNGYAFTAANFSNPVTTPANDINFSATIPNYSISGTVKNNLSAGIPGVVMSDGTRWVLTDANGNFTINNIPEGTYTLTATKSGLSFFSQGFSNPIVIAGGSVTGCNFFLETYNIFGEVFGASQAATITIGSSTTSSSLSGGHWRYFLSGITPGVWNLNATLNGWTVSPSTFTNPIVVNASMSGYNFNAVSGTVYNISGKITMGGLPLVGVIVGDGARTSSTDSQGKYFIPNVPNGTYNVVPTKSGYTFTPPNVNVTILDAVATNMNFTASSPLPFFEVIAPIDSTILTNNPSVIFVGTAKSSATVTNVTINGNVASTSNSYTNWNFTLNNLSPGTNTIVAIATDKALKSATNLIRLVYAPPGTYEYFAIRYWGFTFGKILGASPNADPDGDGMNNFSEFLTGTHPKDRTDYLHIFEILSDSSSSQIGAAVKPGYSYHLEGSSDLQNWSNLNLSITASTTTTNFNSNVSEPRYFYRVKSP